MAVPGKARIFGTMPVRLDPARRGVPAYLAWEAFEQSRATPPLEDFPHQGHARVDLETVEVPDADAAAMHSAFPDTHWGLKGSAGRWEGHAWTVNLYARS